MRRLLPLLLLALAAAAALPAAAHAASGVLKPVACIVDVGSNQTEGCEKARGLDDAAFHVVSPDGRFAYATGRQADAIVVMKRNRTTGKLTQPKGAAGCIAENAPAEFGCTPGVALDRPGGIAISPDGRHLYVAAYYSDTVWSFSRDVKTGALTAVNCLQAERHTLIPPCVAIPGLDGPTYLATSPDGRHVYVTGADDSTVTALVRDGATGALAFAACLRDAGNPAPATCTGATGLRDVRQLALSPDGANVYTAGSGSNSVGAYARNADTGALTFLGCITDDGTSGTNITPTPGCTPSTGLDYVQFLTVSPDGRNVYGSGTDVHTVAAFSRDPATGNIAALPAPDGCVSDITDGAGLCNAGVGVALPYGIVLTRDGTQLYTGSFGYGSVSSFTRDLTTGFLSQFGPCYSEQDPYCDKLEGLGRAGYIALSPDERFLGVNAPDGDRITVLARGGDAGRITIRTTSAKAKRNKVTLKLTCAKKFVMGCVGEAYVAFEDRSVGRVYDLSKRAAYDLPAGGQASVTITLLPKAIAARGLGKAFRGTAIAVSHDPAEDTTNTTWRVLRVT